MSYLYIFTFISIILSLLKSPQKTKKALKISLKKFLNILPAFLIMLILVSIILYFIPEKVISHYLGTTHKYYAMAIASFFGSITFMPGFIAYPLCGLLLKKGVPYMVLSAFSTTLMMVGIVTYPVEKSYFGKKVTILRNLISFIIAIIVAIVTGIAFGEISL